MRYLEKQSQSTLSQTDGILKSPTRTKKSTLSNFPPCLSLNERDYLTFDSLITEWRIQKRVEEQFNAFVTGFNELIPPDLVNVFDERELELLIGGIADIDVEDWKKHTDYRGYTEQDEVIKNFWTVSITISFSFSDATTLLIMLHSAFEVGMPNRNQDCCNLLLVLLESL